MSETHITRHAHITDPDAAFEGLQKENDTLTALIASLEERTLSAEELAYVRNKKMAEDNAAWLWRMIRTNAPWVTVVCSLIGSGMYWLATHTIQIGAPK